VGERVYDALWKAGIRHRGVGSRGMTLSVPEPDAARARDVLEKLKRDYHLDLHIVAADGGSSSAR